ncbi:MAG: tRNA 2-thiouridine(34) synthase MnmA [Actinomycetota bacterium]
MKRKVVVAMSGGVDSSVAAALMKQDGYDVTGVMLKLWKGAAANNESGCCSVDAADDARRVAQVLDIPFYVLNFADRFSDTVIANFKAQYSAGLTPNPCVECNRSVKFRALMDRAKAWGADLLATGHYARIAESEGRLRLFRGSDAGKDQSYVLYMLTQQELACARFPVGEYSKGEIRDIARSLGLRVAGKAESQDLCFVPAGDTHSFISDSIPAASRPGPIVDHEGERLGTHRGFGHYTVGQRRGLGIGNGLPLYVTEVRATDNTIVVGSQDEGLVTEITLSGANLVSPVAPEPRETAFVASVMTRYRGPEEPAQIAIEGTRALVRFPRPVRRPAPGQAAVFYRGDEVLGGGIIERGRP